MSLSKMVREAIADGMSDPGVIAAHIAMELTPEDRDKTFNHLLRLYVRLCITRRRRSLHSGPPAVAPALPAFSYPEPETRAAEKAKNQATALRSAEKQRARLQNWAKQRADNDPVCLGVDNWKKLADCSLEEVLQLAEKRREDAAANIKVAERFEWLAKKMKAARAKTVGAVSEKTLEEYYS